MWRSEDNLQRWLAPSFHHVGPRNPVVRLGGKFFYLLSHLSSLRLLGEREALPRQERWAT